MNRTVTTEKGRSDEGNECRLRTPLGLLGFEKIKSFTLQAEPHDEPFLWLKAAGTTDLAFLVISPFVVVPNYRPEIPEEDARFLGLNSPEEALIFNIVTVRGPGQATVNLKGPIVLNRSTLLAKQVIPLNAPELSVAHPLPVQGQ